MDRLARLLAIAMLANATSAEAQRPVVIVPDNYPTIQAALDAGASEILVRPGTYSETPVITTIPPEPFPSNDDLIIRGMVPDGAPPDSLPLVAGLVFDDFTRGFTHTPSIAISYLHFSKPVENAFDIAPFSNPLVLTFMRCVFDKGISDARATVGGQLEYDFRSCTMDGGTLGAVFLVQPERAYLESCVIRHRITFGAGSWSTFFTMANNQLTHPVGSTGVGVEILYAEGDVDILGNTFEGYGIPLQVSQAGCPYVRVENNTFTGPGRYGVDFGDLGGCVNAYINRNRFVGFDVGIRLENKPDPYGSSMFFGAADNRIENCGAAGIHVTGAAGISVSRDTILSCGTGAILTTDNYATPSVSATGNIILWCSGNGIAIQAEYASIVANVVGHCGGDGIVAAVTPGAWWETTQLRRNTSFRNAGSGYVLTRSSGGLPSQIDRNIGYGNGRYGIEMTSSDSLTIACNDWFGNTLNAVQGVALSPTDLAVDPLFCGLSQDDVHLALDSPMANAAGCGLIGALGIGCDSLTTPVLVDQFTAWRDPDGRIVIAWRIRGELSAQVRVERAEHTQGPWVRVAGMPEADGALLTLVDEDAEPSRAYWYRLIEEDALGGVQVVATTLIDASTHGDAFALEPIGGNPGAGPFTIRFRVPTPATLDVQIFDLQGRRIAQLASGAWPAGNHEVRWSGSDASGRLNVGIHLIRYRFPGGQATQRLVLIR